MSGIENSQVVIEHLRKKLSHDVEKYLTGDYKAVALHSSSIMVAANHAALDMFGYTDDEMVGMNAWHFFHSRSAQVIMQKLMEKSTEPYRVTGLRKDKSEFEVEIKGYDFEEYGETIRVVLLKEV